jgi:hypothetical protein
MQICTHEEKKIHTSTTYTHLQQKDINRKQKCNSILSRHTKRNYFVQTHKKKTHRDVTQNTTHIHTLTTLTHNTHVHTVHKVLK